MLKNTVLLIVTVVIFLLISELIIRQYYPVFSYSYPQHYFVTDDELGYDISTNVPIASHSLAWEGLEFDIWSNDLGCFDYDFDKEENYYLLVGDSFTWGYADFEDKWGYLLEKNLERRVLKCGVTGYETKGQLIKAKKIINRVSNKPEMIIVGYFVGNDVKDRYLFPYKTVYDGHLVRTRYLSDTDGGIKIKTKKDLESEYKNFRHIRSKKNLGGFEYYLLQKSSIYGMYHRIRYPIKIDVPEVDVILSGVKRTITLDESLIYRVRNKKWEDEAWQLHLGDINAFVRYADSIDSKILFVLIPAKEQVYTFLQKKGVEYSKPNQLLTEFFKKNSIEFIDLLDEFSESASGQSVDTIVEGDGYYYPKDAHWNANGNRLAADVVYRYLSK